MNLYTYVNNNPLKYADPTGHSIKDIVDKAVKTVKTVKTVKESINNALKNQQRDDWALFANIIKDKGFSSTASLIKHSLQDNPTALYLNQWSYEAELIKKNQLYKDKIQSVINEANKKMSTQINESVGIQFEKVDNPDLFVGIHAATLEINGHIDEQGNWRTTVSLYDYFDFDQHWERVNNISFSSAAWFINNIAAFSNDNGAIVSYGVNIDLGASSYYSWRRME